MNYLVFHIFKISVCSSVKFWHIGIIWFTTRFLFNLWLSRLSRLPHLVRYWLKRFRSYFYQLLYNRLYTVEIPSWTIRLRHFRSISGFYCTKIFAVYPFWAVMNGSIPQWAHSHLQTIPWPPAAMNELSAAVFPPKKVSQSEFDSWYISKRKLINPGGKSSHSSGNSTLQNSTDCTFCGKLGGSWLRKPGIYEPPGPGTDRFESVQFFISCSRWTIMR